VALRLVPYNLELTGAKEAMLYLRLSLILLNMISSLN